MKNNVFIGCSSFAVGYWKGIFYPEDLPSKDYLRYYSSVVKAVEINSTFYRKPTLKTLEKWKNETPDHFKFFIKIPKTITHISKLDNTAELVSEFCSHTSGTLNKKLGGFLFQLPPSFIYSDENLEKVIKTVDSQYLNVVEFRNKSWWNNDVMLKLKEHHIIFSGVSFPKDISDEFVINNEDFAYYRLHGVPNLFKSSYSTEFLKDLSQKIKNYKGISYIFFNNTNGVAGIENALTLMRLCEKSDQV